jgi:hypothetical protein
MPTFYYCQNCGYDLSYWVVYQDGRPCVCPCCQVPLDPNAFRSAFWEERIKGLLLLFGLFSVPGVVAASYYGSGVPLILGTTLAGLVVLGIALHIYRARRARALRRGAPQRTYRLRYPLSFLGLVSLLAMAYLSAPYGPTIVAIVYGIAGLVLVCLGTQAKRWTAEGRHDAPGVFMMWLGLALLVYPAYHGVSEGVGWAKGKRDRESLDEGLIRMFHRPPDGLELAGKRLPDFRGIARYGEHRYRIHVMARPDGQGYDLVAEPVGDAPLPGKKD